MAKKQEDSKEKLREKLEADTKAFLNSGGTVESVKTGRSGVDSTKPRSRHIQLGKKDKVT